MRIQWNDISSFGPFPDNWEIVKLIEVGNISKGAGISKSEIKNDGLPAIRYGELYTKHNYYIKEFNSFVDQDSADSSKKLKYGDILFAGSGETAEEIGKCAAYLNDCDAYASGDIIIYHPTKDDPMFLGYLLNHDVVNRQKFRTAQGHSVVHIYGVQIGNIKIPLPPLPEQRKIAEILSTWDEAIQKLQQLIDKKKELKKGLMQQLLTGKKRFPEFIPPGGTKYKETKLGMIPEDWEVIHIDQLGDTYSGLSGKSKEDFGEGKPYIPYLNIFQNSKIDVEYLDRVQIGDNEKQNKVSFGDVFFTTSSETPDEVGISSVLLNNIEDCYLNSFCFGLRFHDSTKLIPEFARYLFRGRLFRKELFKLAQGATRYNLSKSAFIKTSVALPKPLEQEKIAEVLSNMDAEINMLHMQKSNLFIQKKGLMQQLLTGKVRVKAN